VTRWNDRRELDVIGAIDKRSFTSETLNFDWGVYAPRLYPFHPRPTAGHEFAVRWLPLTRRSVGAEVVAEAVLAKVDGASRSRSRRRTSTVWWRSAR
jgi:hypothetical protein